MMVTIECDLRGLFGPARDQGARPTCMAFAASDTHAAVRPGWEPLSCEYAYFHAVKRDGGGPNDGATTKGMLEAIKEDGQPPEAVWKYLSILPVDIALWKPPANSDPIYKRASDRSANSLADIKQKLDQGVPVILTMLLSDAFYFPDANAVVAASEPPDPKRRHAVIAVGYGALKSGKKAILVRNSWGGSWGVDGYAWVTEDYLAPRLNGIAEMREDVLDVSTNRNTADVRSRMA